MRFLLEFSRYFRWKGRIVQNQGIQRTPNNIGHQTGVGVHMMGWRLHQKTGEIAPNLTRVEIEEYNIVDFRGKPQPD
jgi:hypothetical protein